MLTPPCCNGGTAFLLDWVADAAVNSYPRMLCILREEVLVMTAEVEQRHGQSVLLSGGPALQQLLSLVTRLHHALYIW